MAPINQETMNLLKGFLGREVILQRVNSGKISSYRTKLYKIIYFGAINDEPLIGMNSAIFQVIDVETGKTLMYNPVIKATLDWNDAGIMWWLRFRSYGFLVAFGVSSVGIRMQKYMGWQRSEDIFSV